MNRKMMDKPEVSDAIDIAMSRRHFLWQAGGGLGAIALACLLQEEAAANGDSNRKSKIENQKSNGLLTPTHFPARAKRVIQIFCTGGVSHIDTFDFKPELIKSDGKAMT